MAARAKSDKVQLQSHEALILDILNRLPAPGGAHARHSDLAELVPVGDGVVDWEAMPRSCDPVFVLDNPANNVRRRGTLETQLSQMVLGRPEEFAATSSVPTRPLGERSRGMIKRWQVESFTVVLRQLADGTGRRLHIVDFGCGTGTLLLPLAWMFPHCQFVGVEMKPAAVALLQERARAAGLANVCAARCMIEEYVDQPFDVCLALHACGNATDAALQLAARRRAAYVVSPCCVGKLKFSLAGGSSFSTSHHVYTPHMPGERPVSRATPAAAPVAGSSVAGTPPASGASAPGASPAACPSPAADAPAASGASSASGASPAAGSAPEKGTGQRRGTGTADGMEADGQSKQPSHRGPGPGHGDADGGAAEKGSPSEGAGGGAESGADGGQRVAVGELRHPRSRWLREHLPDPEAHFRIMAKVADQNHSGAPERTPQEPKAGSVSVAAAAAHACKLHVELDRNLAAREDGYRVGLFKCFQWQQMAKNDLLVGVPAERSEWTHLADSLARLEAGT